MKIIKGNNISSKDKIYRLFLHVPVGIITSFLFLVNPSLTIIFGIGFLVYELDQDWRIEDSAYADIYGWLVGIVIGAIGLFIYFKMI